MTGKITINDIFDNDNDWGYKNEYEINMEHLSDEFGESAYGVNNQVKLLRNVLVVMFLTVLFIYVAIC